MKILALDLASQTGIAFGRPGERPVLRTEKLGITHPQRFAQAMITTRKLCREFKPDLIVIEAPLAAGGGGTKANPELAMGIRGCVIGMAFIEGVSTAQYPVQTIRKHFLGHGGLKRAEAKRKTVARCRALGWNPQTEDEADAAALWDLTCQLRCKQSTAPMGGLFDQN